MKKITSIKQLRNNKYELLIDGEKHIIYGDVLLDCGIFKPQEVNTATYMKLVNLNHYYDAYHKIVSYLNYKKRTEKEVKIKLNKIAVNKKDIETIIAKLYENNLLNDDNYLDSYVNDQIKLTLNGPFKIKYNLIKLGFKEDIIDDYINKIDSDLWQSRVEKITDKYLKTKNHLSKKAFIQKLRNELNSLGYQENHYIDIINNLSLSDQDNLQKDYLKYKDKLSKKYTGDQLELMVKKKLYSLGYDINDIKKDIN